MACPIVDLEMGIGGTVFRFDAIQRRELSADVVSYGVRIWVGGLVCSTVVSVLSSPAYVITLVDWTYKYVISSLRTS